MPFLSFPSGSVFLTLFCLHIWLFRLTAVHKSNCLFFLDALRTLTYRWEGGGGVVVAFHIMWPFLVFVRPTKEKRRERKGKDGCKHSWLLKGEIYSWVIKVYDWILSAIGCSWPRGARSMNMNFMLLSIPWSFPCISSRLSYRALKRLFSLVLQLDYNQSCAVSRRRCTR